MVTHSSAIEDLSELPRICVIGTGYLGATHAVCMAELGYEVIGVDVDAGKIDKLNSGQTPFHELGLDELLDKNLTAGRLHFTTDFRHAAEWGDVHFICVGTPQQANGLAADLQYLEAAVISLAQHITKPALIVGKSTVPVGTAQWVHSLVQHHCPISKVDVAWNPEFLREGFAIEDTLRPDRLVFGTTNDRALNTLRQVYAGVFTLAESENREVPVVETDFATAELVKVSANSFLATKISFINAIADVCAVAGADVTQLARAIGYDDRIGAKFLRAGLGFGGGCLPKDIRAFQARAQELGVGESLNFLAEVDAINLRRRQQIVDQTKALIGTVEGARITVLGASFKPDSDDVRDSPAIWVISKLQAAGAKVTVYDPQASDNARQLTSDVVYAPAASDALNHADIVLVLTEWQEFIDIDPTQALQLVNTAQIIDARNCLNPTSWRQAGWNYYSVGRP